MTWINSDSNFENSHPQKRESRSNFWLYIFEVKRCQNLSKNKCRMVCQPMLALVNVSFEHCPSRLSAGHVLSVDFPSQPLREYEWIPSQTDLKFLNVSTFQQPQSLLHTMANSFLWNILWIYTILYNIYYIYHQFVSSISCHALIAISAISLKETRLAAGCDFPPPRGPAEKSPGEVKRKAQWRKNKDI